MSSDTKHDTNKEPDYEDRDIQLKPILWFGLFTTLFTIATFYGVAALFRNYAAKEELRPLSGVPVLDRQIPVEPTLQILEPDDYKAYKAQEDLGMQTYAWVDRASGVVQIPIETAMELVAKKGLPVRQAKP